MPDNAKSAVSVEGLRKRYNGVEALCGVSFEVFTGEIFGLLGPNGAGKTTVLECILGLRRPDAGAVRLSPMPGALLQGASLQDKITPRQALELFGSFYRDPFEAGELIARFDLEDKADAAFIDAFGRAAATAVSGARAGEPARRADPGRAHRRARSPGAANVAAI